MAKEFDFMGMVNDMAKKIEEKAKELQARSIFGYYWDGKITEGEKLLGHLSDEHLKRLVIQGNLMISKAANVRAEREKKADTDGVG